MGDATTTTDVAVIGGGIAGLTAAAYAARGGATVTLLDARTDLGGRGRTQVDAGFHFNEGPHALYRDGAGTAALHDLGIRPDGKMPPLRNPRASLDGRLVRMPPARAVAQTAALLAHLGRDAADPAWIDASASEWIAGRVLDPVARHVVAALVRVSSYAGDLDTFSADGAIIQLKSSLKGVLYLHGGWRQIVTALATVARDAGATVDAGHKVTSVRADGGRWIVERDGAPAVAARRIVLAAGGPGHADRLLGASSPTITAAAHDAVPVHAACLDLGLDELPVPGRRFVLGLDRPTYASVHTAAARLSDTGGQLLHVMRYEPPAGEDAPTALRELHHVADEIQPGWREHELARQVGTHRVVAFDRPRPGTGMGGRPGAVVPDLDGVFVAGDWVGPDGLIGGAALASGRAAGVAAARSAALSAGPVLQPVS
jgi:phytoene dehydrogenase-like protein